MFNACWNTSTRLRVKNSGLCPQSCGFQITDSNQLSEPQVQDHEKRITAMEKYEIGRFVKPL